MHQPYEQRLKHKADFRVWYKFLNPEEGGRQKLPYQGLRCDFSYEEGDDKIYMIWPEFEEENREVILESDKPVPAEGTALMWIIVSERRPYHLRKISIGAKGFFREGRVTAICKVIEILDLHKNPIR